MMTKNVTRRKQYKAPKIVYEGRIGTRAGSTRGAGNNSAKLDLFKSDE